MDYAIKDWKPYEKNTLQGFFTLVVGPFEIKNMMLHKKGTREWIGFPAKEYTDRDGNRQYANIIDLPDKERYWQFVKWCVKQLRGGTM